jgi:asparagine synthase (glutamine-hydrolysing)
MKKVLSNRLVMDEFLGWRKHVDNDVSIWIKGYLINLNISDLFQKVSVFLSEETIPCAKISYWINTVRGHFAIVIETPFWVFASVDKICSIPLFYAESEASVTIGNNALSLIKKNKINTENIDYNSAIEIAMSGFTTGSSSIYNGFYHLVSGECLLLDNDGVLQRTKYYKYSPWNVVNKSNEEFQLELSNTMLRVISDMADSVDGRQIVIPLSAGNDSRYIASALRHIGYDNVYCFSYGRKNNFEIQSARSIAEKLNYPWEPILINSHEQRKLFSQKKFKDFLEFSDTLSSSPVLIDYNAVHNLCANNKIDSDAVFVNGNAGDFITGNHIDPYFYNMDDSTIDVKQIINNYIDKHYSLWGCLKTKNNISFIYNNINAMIDDILNQNDIDDRMLWSVMESIEWSGRQSNIVTMTQRSYEFFNHEWRLPLWDPVLMDFWEKVPLHLKRKQNMYSDVLKRNNWGEVWSNEIPINEYDIKPFSLKIVRLFFKFFVGFLGKESWHKFDKRVFGYFIDTSVAVSYTPYFDIFFDECGARNRNSWITRINLEKHKVKLSDLM